jgi:hypothetical protein
MFKEQTGILFTNSYYKLTTTLKNQSNLLLATDLFRDEVKRDLYKIIISVVEKKFLKFAKNKKKTLKFNETKKVFLELVNESLEKFFNVYYTPFLKIDSNIIQKSLYIKTTSEDLNTLINILFSSFLKKESKVFKLTFVPIYPAPSANLIELLLDNLVVEVSNCVARVIINEFSLVPDIRQNWYKSNFLSIRNIEKFKNNLAWQDRTIVFIRRPRNIYNSEYGVWSIRRNGIYYRVIYANRVNQLLNLNKASLVMVNYLECQDFILGRLDETIFLASRGTQYFLTSVLGQAFGLIWKGIVEGLKK